MQHRLLWLFGTDTFFALTRQAVYAESLASMLDQGLNREAAMSLAGVVPNQPSTTQMPSLLNWALTTEANEADAAETLRFVSRAYRQIAERRASLRQVWLPVVLGAVLGGSCVLLFGLSLFLPYVQLLKHLTLPWEI